MICSFRNNTESFVRNCSPSRLKLITQPRKEESRAKWKKLIFYPEAGRLEFLDSIPEIFPFTVYLFRQVCGTLVVRMSNTLIMKGLVISSANSTCVLWFVRNDFLSSVSWENCRACHYQMPHISHISSRYWAQSAGGTYESCYCRWELSGQRQTDRQTDRTDSLNRQTEHSWHVWGVAEVWWGEPAQASPARVICVVTAWEWVLPPTLGIFGQWQACVETNLSGPIIMVTFPAGPHTSHRSHWSLATETDLVISQKAGL